MLQTETQVSTEAPQIKALFENQTAELERIKEYALSEGIKPLDGALLADPNTAATLVIPAYNEGFKIKETLEAIEKSTQPLEVVVVDNASKDNTASVVQSFNGSYPLKLINCQTPGAGHARKAGADQVIAGIIERGSGPGRIILFADGDTLIDPQFAEEAQKVLTEYHIASGFYKYPDWLDEGIYKKFGIENCFGYVSDLALKLHDKGLIIAGTTGANTAMDAYAYASIGGSKELYGPDGERLKGQDRAMGLRARGIGLDVGFLRTRNDTSPRRLFDALLRKSDLAGSYQGLSKIRYPHGDDHKLFNAAINQVPKEKWLDEQSSRITYLVVNNAFLPIINGVQSIEPAEKLLGKNHLVIEMVRDLKSRPHEASEVSLVAAVNPYLKDILSRL